MSWTLYYSTLFNPASPGATSITDLNTNDSAYPGVDTAVDLINGTVGNVWGIEPFYSAILSRGDLLTVQCLDCYAERDGTGWVLYVPRFGAEIRGDYLMTAGSLTFLNVDAGFFKIGPLVNASGEFIPPFWTNYVKTYENGVGSVGTIGGWTP